MGEFDQMYREVILDHYRNPRGHGEMAAADAEAEGQNPLCGDEVSIFVRFGEDGDTIDEVMFKGRGCAISQAATSMLTEMVQGRSATEIATLPKDELLEEIGIPLTRLPCTISVSIEVAACEIAHPWPANLTSSIVSASAPKRT